MNQFHTYTARTLRTSFALPGEQSHHLFSSSERNQRCSSPGTCTGKLYTMSTEGADQRGCKVQIACKW